MIPLYFLAGIGVITAYVAYCVLSWPVLTEGEKRFSIFLIGVSLGAFVALLLLYVTLLGYGFIQAPF